MAVYNGRYTITFGDLDANGRFAGSLNTWDDWHLIPASRPTMAMPGYESKLVVIPGMHGSLDLSTYLTGYPVYGNREGSFKFYADHESYHDGEDWVSVKHRIMRELHGKRWKMRLDEDPGWFYDGRFTVGEWSSDKDFSSVSINYQVAPYKISIIEQGTHDVLWDPFNFELDYDYYVFHQLQVTTTRTFTINARGKIITPHINFHKTLSTVGDAVTATFKGVTKTVNFTADQGNLGTATDEEATLTLSGSGYVTISFREKSL